MEGLRRHWLVVRVVMHGFAAIATACGGDAQAADAPRKAWVEIVRFAGAPVRVVRGTGEAVAVPTSAISPTAPSVSHATVERIAFAGAAPTSVTIVRGMEAAGTLAFDRIAHAVHGAESSHGADPNMWRPDPNGPQGPMQVSEAAASDVGGGNRFDTAQNRLLGRAYLARMFRRYRNWPDALAAYNWGPGNVDAWIGGGRNAGQLPLETRRYIDRVLRAARIAAAVVEARLPATR